MKTNFLNSPRTYEVNGITIKDFGKIELSNDEMVTFVTKEGSECDFTSKEWGFYIAPSLNGRLKRMGFKSALVVNEYNKIYIMAVENNKIDVFKKYLKDNHDNRLICWLDEWFVEEE